MSDYYSPRESSDTLDTDSVKKRRIIKTDSQRNFIIIIIIFLRDTYRDSLGHLMHSWTVWQLCRISEN